MDKRYTIIVTDNDGGPIRQLSFSLHRIKWVAGLAVGAAFLIFGILVDYGSLLVDSRYLNKIRVENKIIEEKFDQLEKQVAQVESELVGVMNYSNKLKMITNIRGKNRSLKLSLNEKGGDIERSTARKLASELPLESSWMTDSPASRVTDVELRIKKSKEMAVLQKQNVFELWQKLSEKKNLLDSTPTINPVAGWISSHFGFRSDPIHKRKVMHHGLDIAADHGALVRAPASGVVSYVGHESGYGKVVAIDHGYGVKTRYGHNSKIFVRLGQRVDRRDVISAVGNTGRSTSAHLHYEVRVKNVPVNPENYILEESF